MSVSVEQLENRLQAAGLRAPTGAQTTLVDYLALLEKWNRAYNLTAVRDPAEAVSRHVLDSATALPFLRGTRMLDMGSGAGFPGLVLAILAPETQWVLAESAGKKARFLEHAVRELGLRERVSVYAERVESYPPGPGFDTVTARALADLASLAAWAEPLLAPAGRLVALKGRRVEVETELRALSPDWRAQAHAVTVPGLDAERHVVVAERKSGEGKA